MSDYDLACEYITRSLNRLEETKRQIENGRFDTAISAAQESIELSIKSIFLMLRGTHARKHEISDGDFSNILGSIPSELRHLNFARVWLINKFWSNLYTTAKYGSQTLKIGASGLFQKEEAELAYKHAQEANCVAYSLSANRMFWPKH